MSKKLNYRGLYRTHSHLIQRRRPNRSSGLLCSHANMISMRSGDKTNSCILTKWPQTTDLWSNRHKPASNSFILKGVDWIELHWIFFVRELTKASSVLFSSIGASVYYCFQNTELKRTKYAPVILRAAACPSCKSWLWRSPQNSSKQTRCAYRNIMNRMVTVTWEKRSFILTEIL